MVIYLLILMVFLIAMISRKEKNIIVNKADRNLNINVAVFISFVLLVFFYTVRGDSVGWDTGNYFFYFNNLASFGYDSFLEKGWIILMNVIHFFSSNHLFYNFIVGFIGISIYYWAAKRLSANMNLSIVLYFMQGMWFNLMNQQRNAIAVCICMIGFYFLTEKKYVCACLFVFVAFFIHDSAIIFFVFILFDILTVRLRRSSYLIFVIGAVFTILFYKPIYSFLVVRFYPSYTTEAHLIGATAGGNLKMMFFYLIIGGFIYYIDKRKSVEQRWEGDEVTLQKQMLFERKKYLLYLAIMYSVFLQFLSKNNTMIARFSNYFSVYLTILLPNVLSQIKSVNGKRNCTILILLLYFVYMLIYLKFSENGFGRDKVIPYVFYSS